jgi:hypothetical protein
MDKIKQYLQITNIKPEYHILEQPYYKVTKKKLILNGKELELYYLDEFDSYIENPKDLII